MPDTEAAIGYGAKFSIGDGATPEVFTDLAEVFDITPPAPSTDVVDATHMQSPNKTREFIEGLTDPGECSIEMNFVPGSAADLAIQAWAGKKNCRITFPNNVKWTFAAIKTGYEPAVPNEDKMTATVSMKISGSVVAS